MIDSAHRVLEHESRCKHWHGHRWEIEITCSSQKLDQLGRVIDFGVIKDVFGKWLDENLDHNSILNSKDPLFTELTKAQLEAVLMGKQPYVLQDCNPTAENLSILLYGIANALLKENDIQCTHVRVYETPNCYADYQE